MNLKKLSVVVVAGVVMLSSAIALAVRLRPNVEIEIGAGRDRYMVNGTVKAFNENTENLPYIDGTNKRLMLPLRTVVEELKGSVSFNNNDGTIELLYENKNLRMHMNTQQAVLNGYPIVLSDMPISANGSIYVPAEFFEDYFGADILWDDTKKQITLKTKRVFLPVVAVNKKVKEIKEGSYNIEIPVVTGLNDGNFEKNLNKTLSNVEILEADEFLTKAQYAYKEGEAAYTRNTSCTVHYSRQEMISILISGETSSAKSSSPIKKAINIDLQGQKGLLLGDLFRDENYLPKLVKYMDMPAYYMEMPAYLLTSTINRQFYFNEKQQLVLFFQKDGSYEEFAVDWDEIEGMLNPQYRFFTTAKQE